MQLLHTLTQACGEFEKRRCSYCLIGGYAASLYRTIERVTRDIDFALVAKPPIRSQKVAEDIIKALGFKPAVGFIAGRQRKGRTSRIAMVTSTPVKGEFTAVIDILLPTLPWLSEAVRRAQFNLIDLGFSKVPVITPEDLIVAKCYALKGAPDRFQDLDDLKELFSGAVELEYDYIKLALDNLKLAIPAILKAAAPRELKRFCQGK